MSRIFDALKRAQQARLSAGENYRSAPSHAERRRCPRWRAHVPVFVYGHGSALQPFHEEAYSAVVSDLGALLVMCATVRPGQILLLTNKATQVEQECRVNRVGEHDLQSVEVAVEFTHRAPDFWRLMSPRQTADSADGAETPVSGRREP